MGVLPSQLHSAMPQLCRRRLCHDQGLLLPPQSLAYNSATSFWFSLESCYPHQVTAVKVTMNPRCGTIVDFDLPMQSTFRSAGQGIADWPDWHNPAKASEDWHLEIAELPLSGCAFAIASFWWNRITFLPPSSMDQDSGSRSVNDWAGIWNIPAHWKKTQQKSSLIERCTSAKARKMKALLDGDFLQKCGTQSCRGFYACFRCFDGALPFTSSEWCISLLMPLGTLL